MEPSKRRARPKAFGRREATVCCGVWPSQVGRLFWVQEIVGSNPTTPTIIKITSSLDGPEGPPWRAVEKWLTHLAHTQEIGGSNPPCATIRDETVRTVNRPAQRASAARPS